MGARFTSEVLQKKKLDDPLVGTHRNEMMMAVVALLLLIDLRLRC